MVAIASTAVALLVLAAGPSNAAYVSVFVGRGIEFTGDRDFARADMRMTDPSPGASLSLSFGVGGVDIIDSVSVVLVQEGGDNSSRLVKLWYVGEWKNAKAENCEGEYFVECRRGGFDWVKGRDYRVTIDRGDRTDAGRLWVVKIKDTESGDVTKLFSARSPHDRLSRNFNSASLGVEANGCGSLGTSIGVVEKPVVRDGTTVSWGDVHKSKQDCPDATTTGALDSGTVRFKIAE